MTEHETLIYGGFVFMILIFLISRIGSNTKQMPKKPEPLQAERAYQNAPEVPGNFDSNALQTARGMVSELERYPDPTSRTLALAEMLHRQKQYEARTAERAWQEQRKEADAFDKVLGLIDRISGRNQQIQQTPPQGRYPEYPPYPPQQGRVDGYRHFRGIDGPEYPERERWRM